MFKYSGLKICSLGLGAAPTTFARVTRVNGEPIVDSKGPNDAATVKTSNRSAYASSEAFAAPSKTLSVLSQSRRHYLHATTATRAPSAAAAAAAATNASSSLEESHSHSYQQQHYAVATTASSANGGASAVTIADQREAATKVWGSLHATPNALASAETGSAGTVRITHNLNYGNCRWQASCVEVRPRIKDDETDEEKLNPVIAKRNKQFGQIMPWEKKAWEQKTKFKRSDKFPEDDNVEIVFYFETHGHDGVGLKGYQNIAARVSDGDLPGECSNLTAVGGFATWTVPRSEFVALTESTPLLGDMLSDAPVMRRGADGAPIVDTKSDNDGDATSGDEGSSSAATYCSTDGDTSEVEELRRVTIRMSSSSDRARRAEVPEAQTV